MSDHPGLLDTRASNHPGLLDTRASDHPVWHADPVLLEIRGHHLPGRTWEVDGEPRGNVHVGIQIGRAPAQLVRGDADTATWTTEITVHTLDDGTLDFRGPAVQGRRGERFVYLTWGDVGTDGSFDMFRRAKLMLSDVAEAADARGGAPGSRVIASVHLTDDRGGPRCARLRPPALELSAD
jgi:hypothetical protein